MIDEHFQGESNPQNQVKSECAPNGPKCGWSRIYQMMCASLSFFLGSFFSAQALFVHCNLERPMFFIYSNLEQVISVSIESSVISTQGRRKSFCTFMVKGYLTALFARGMVFKKNSQIFAVTMGIWGLGEFRRSCMVLYYILHLSQGSELPEDV